MNRLCIESAYAESERFTVTENVEFARAVCRYALARGYVPYASHLFFPGILDDSRPQERELGIRAGFAWSQHATEVWFCLRPDEELSQGMKEAVGYFSYIGIPMKLARFDQAGTRILEWEVLP